MESISNEINNGYGDEKNKEIEEQILFKNLSFKNVFFKYDNKDNYIIEDNF